MTIEIHIHGAATIHVHGADGAEVIHINGKPAEIVKPVAPDVHLDIELRDGGIHVVSQNAPAAAKAAFDLMRGDITEIIKDDLVGGPAVSRMITKHADGLAKLGVWSASIWRGDAFGDGDLLGGWNRRPSSRLLEP